MESQELKLDVADNVKTLFERTELLSRIHPLLAAGGATCKCTPSNCATPCVAVVATNTASHWPKT